MSIASRLSNGWKISMNSFKILKENKQLIIFPILSGASMIVITTSFIVAAVFANQTVSEALDGDNNRFYYYLLIFGFYLINYFIVIFFNVALMHCVRQYFLGEEVSLREGLNFSFSRIGVILGWSVVAATVGSILKIVQQETGIVGKIITAIIGVVWNIATFFIVPVLAYENVGPIEGIKRSASIMKEKWGESVAGNFSLGLVQLLALLVTALPLYFIGSLVNDLLGIALAAFAGIFVIAIISAARGIFISGVYHRLHGHEIQLISSDTVDELFVPKQAKKLW